MNNDRFKFRVWDKQAAHYVNGCLMSNGDLLGDVEESDVVIEQCTGLRDKNGTLIYEGDVIEYRQGAFSGRFPVEWMTCNGMFSFGVDPCYIDNVEVIGNIHEMVKNERVQGGRLCRQELKHGCVISAVKRA